MARLRGILSGCLSRLTALFLGLVLAFALGEAAVRLLVPGYAPIAFDVYYKDARGELRLKPHERRQHASPEWNVRIETDSLGFRDVDRPPRPGQPVVIVLGDSMAFGWGVEMREAFPSRLEAALAAEGVRVLNAAIPGTGTTDQLRLLRELLETMRVDVLVLTFFVGNDFDDVASGGTAQYEVVDGLLVFKGQERGPGRRLSALLKRKSHLAQLVAERWWRLEAARAARLPVEQREHPGLERRDAFLRRYVQVHLREPFPPRLERGVAETLAALEEMERLCAGQGARLILAVIPRSIQVYDADRMRYEQAFGVREEDWDLDRPQRILAEWAARNDTVELVDLLPALRDAAAGSPRLYFFPDSHLAAAGHAVVAAELARRTAARPLRAAAPRPE
jgi:lysophospholipase L1-like esterase